MVWRSALAALALSAAQLTAQVTTPVPSLPTPVVAQQTLTTGMVGFTSSQTVELTVLNTAPAATTTLPGCEVQLAFYDSQGHVVKQGTATTIGPGTSTSLTLSRSEVPTATAAASAARVPVRGQVSTVAASTASSSSTVALAACALFPSLEVYDTTTGVTQVFTTDTRALYTGVVPLAVLPAER
jgi:hypothetical protein